MRSAAYARPSADYYKVLELERNASQDDIRTSFYKLSQLYHPTLNTTSESKTNFQLLNEAFVILSDEKSRRAYDLINRVDPHTTVTPPKEQ
jgi:DnaJ-class molecular chaperone